MIRVLGQVSMRQARTKRVEVDSDESGEPTTRRRESRSVGPSFYETRAPASESGRQDSDHRCGLETLS